jgi:hypothetical protein
MLSGWLQDTYAAGGGGVDYGALWRVVSLIGLGAALFFYLAFRERGEVTREPAGAPEPAATV